MPLTWRLRSAASDGSAGGMSWPSHSRSAWLSKSPTGTPRPVARARNSRQRVSSTLRTLSWFMYSKYSELRHQSEQALGSERQGAHVDAEGVRDGVGERGGDADRATFAGSFDAQWIQLR